MSCFLAYDTAVLQHSSIGVPPLRVLTQPVNRQIRLVRMPIARVDSVVTAVLHDVKRERARIFRSDEAVGTARERIECGYNFPPRCAHGGARSRLRILGQLLDDADR